MLHNNNIGLTLGQKILKLDSDSAIYIDSINDYLHDTEQPDHSFEIFENTKRFNLFRSDYLVAKESLMKKLESNHELVEKYFKEKDEHIAQLEIKYKNMKEEL